jgi:hypothetical protein
VTLRACCPLERAVRKTPVPPEGSEGVDPVVWGRVSPLTEETRDVAFYSLAC